MYVRAGAFCRGVCRQLGASLQGSIPSIRFCLLDKQAALLFFGLLGRRRCCLPVPTHVVGPCIGAFTNVLNSQAATEL